MQLANCTTAPSHIRFLCMIYVLMLVIPPCAGFGTVGVILIELRRLEGGFWFLPEVEVVREGGSNAGRGGGGYGNAGTGLRPTGVAGSATHLRPAVHAGPANSSAARAGSPAHRGQPC